MSNEEELKKQRMKQERVAEALRENLRKRKEQMRARKTEVKENTPE